MDEITDKQLLKPCPFCGNTKLKLDKHTRNGRVTYSIRCNSCHARGGTSGCYKTTSSSIRYCPYINGDPTEELMCSYMAIDKWNQRVKGETDESSINRS